MPFDPTLVRGALAVHDPDTYGLSDGAAIATAPDSTTNGNDATQATTAKRPIYKTAIVNGHAVERYDGDPARVGAGTCQTLHTPEIFDATMPEITMYFVVNALTPISPLTNGELYRNYGSPDDRTTFIQAPNGGNFRFNARDTEDDELNVTQGFSSGSWTILTVKIEGATATLRVNGVEATNSNASYGGATFEGDSTLPSIGSFKGVDTPYHGDIAHRIFAGVPHSPMEILDTEVYLANRFGITVDHDAVVRGECTLPSMTLAGTAESETVIETASIAGDLVLPGLTMSGAATSITNARVHLYVGSDGNDTTGTGAIGAKWRTLEKVRDYLRTQQPLDRHYTIHLDHATGLLPVTDTFELIDADTLQDGREVLLYGGDLDADVRGGLRGSVQVTGWTSTGVNGVYSAPFAGVSPRAIWVNGRRRRRVLRGSGLTGSPARTSTGYTAATSDGIFSDPNPQNVELIWNLGASNYNHPRNKVTAVNAGTGAITMNAEAHQYLNRGGGTFPNDHQFLYVQDLPNEIENCKADFDAAVSSGGEGLIYHDESTDTLYYKPYPWESMATADVYAPIVEMLHSAVGVTNPWKVRGCIFEHTDYRMPTGFAERYGNRIYDDAHPLGEWDEEASYYPPAAVYYEDCTGIDFSEGNRVRGCSAMAIHTAGVCSGSIIGNYVRDISGNGIVPGKDSPGVGLSTLIVQNNKVWDTGIDFHGSLAIFGMKHTGSLFEHNWVRRAPYNGISLGQAGNVNPKIRYNRVEQVMQHGRDGAGIGTAYDQAGLVIAENFVDDVTPANETALWNMGQYVDEGGNGVTVQNNVYRNVGHTALFHNLPNPNTVTVTGNFSDDPSSVGFLDSGIQPNTYEAFTLLDEPPQTEAQAIIDNSGLQEPYLSAFSEEEIQGDIIGALTLPSLTMSGTVTAEEAVGAMVAGSLTLPQMTLSGTLTATNGAGVSGALTLPQLTLSGTVTSSTPDVVVMGSLTLPQMTLDGAVTSTTSELELRTVYSEMIDEHGQPRANVTGRLVIPMPQQVASGEWIAAGVILGTSDDDGRITWGNVPTGIDVVVEISDAERAQRITIPSGVTDLRI